jgi:hypothetical protein
MPIAMDLTLSEIDPKLKYLLAVTGFASSHWLAQLGAVRADESLYLMPMLGRACEVISLSSKGTQTYVAPPNSGLHVSFHDSGAINLVSGENRWRLARPAAQRPPMGRLFTIVVKSTDSLVRTTLEEINNPPAKKRVLPLGAHWPSEVTCISVFRSVVGAAWQAPPLGELAQINVHLPLRGKPVEYHLVTWQHRQFKAPPGEVSILMADSD